jgi:pyruvate carboxylase
LPTRYYLTPLKVGQEFQFELDKGKTLIIKLVAIGPLHEETSSRDVYFSLNGEARVVSVIDELPNATNSTKSTLARRPKADSKNKGDVAAPMSGVVVEVRVAPGTIVKIGDPIAVMSAMKMETIITATIAGKIEQVVVAANDSLNAGDLIVVIAKDV